MRSFLQRLFAQPQRRRRNRVSQSQALESRLLLAAVIDSADTLTLQLEQDERLTISTNGTQTRFESSNSVLTGVDLNDTQIFTGLGSNVLTLDDVAAYDTVRIESVGAGSSLGFVDSGSAVYGHDLNLDFSTATIGDMAVDFRGSIHLGNHNLTINSSRRILLWSESQLTTVDGDVRFEVRNTTDSAGHAGRGITVYDAVISSSGTGDIVLNGKGSDVLAEEGWKYGVDVRSDSRIESTSMESEAGRISLVGEGGDGRGSLAGVYIADSTVSSGFGRIFIGGDGGNGSRNFNTGIWLTGATVQSNRTDAGTSALTLQGIGGDGSDSGHGVMLGNNSVVSAVDGALNVRGIGRGDDWASGVRVIESSIRTTGGGSLQIDGDGGFSQSVSHGVRIHRHSVIETDEGNLEITANNQQQSGNFHHGFELGDGSIVRSVTGNIEIRGTRTGEAVGQGHAVKFVNRADEEPVSVVSRSGRIAIQALGTPDVARIYSDPETVIGGPDHRDQIFLEANDFVWKGEGSIQSSGELFVALPSGASLQLGGEEAVGTLSDDELKFLETGFSQITFAAYSDSTRRIERLALDGAFFHDPVILDSNNIVLMGGTAFTSPSVTLDGHVSIKTPHSATIEGDVILSGHSLSLHGPTGGTSLTVTGQFAIRDNPEIRVDWAPSAAEDYQTRHVLVSQSSSTGRFSEGSVQRIARDFHGATVGYENTSITLEYPQHPIGATQVVALSDIESLDSSSTIFGAAAGDRFGQSVVPAGDINGDGIPDLLIGATSVDRQNAENVGAVYLVYGSTDWPAEASIDNEAFNVTQILGADFNDFWGRTIGIGDLNGDGFADFAVPSFNADAAGNQKSQAGDVALIWGAEQLPDIIDLGNLGSAGTMIYGADIDDRTGASVDVIGDINGDDRPDVAIGAYWGDGPQNSAADTGEAHILLGRETWPETIDLAAENDSHITIFGEDIGDEFGVTVFGLGDINDDGEDDFSVAAWRADGPDNDRPGAGATYVFFGGDEWNSDIDLSVTSAADLVVHGATSPDRAGWETHAIGDVTGDGINDLVIPTALQDAADGRSDIGGAVLIPGSASLSGTIDLANPPAEATVILGADAGDIAGRVAVVGDLNADGIDDLAVTAREADRPLDFGSNSGETYILTGRANWPSTIDLSTPLDVGAVILGADDGDESGTMVRGIGDLNGDGQDDIAIGARFADGLNNDLPDAGEVAIISGADLFDATAPVATITTTHDPVTDSSRLVFDVRFSERTDRFNHSDLLVTDQSGSHPFQGIFGVNYRWLSNTHLQVELQRLTNEGSVTLSVAPDSDAIDLAGNLIDHSASTSATYQLSDSPLPPVIVRPEGPVAGDNLVFEWLPSWEATGYEYEIIRFGTETTTWQSGEYFNGATTQWSSPEPVPIGSYRAWVRAKYSDGSVGAWASQAFSINDAVSHLQVEPGQSVDRPTVTFDEVPGATGYRIFATNFTTGASGQIDTVASTNQWTPPEDLPIGRYGFWVRAIGENSFTANWSQSAVYDVYPELEPLQAVTEDRPILEWNAVEGAATYEIYVSGGGQLVNETGLNSTSFQMPSDLTVSNYRAWVRGITSEGQQGPWSPVMKFTGGGRTQVTVADDSGSQIPVFEWWEVSPTSTYEVYVAKDGEPGAYYRQSGISAESFRSIPLPEGSYKVWVGSDGNAWSSGHAFTVSAPSLSVPAPTQLTPNGPVLNPQPTFRWEAVAAAATYDLLLRTGPETQLISGITGNEYTAATAITHEDTEWWVRGVGTFGTLGRFSEVSHINPSGRPVLTVQAAGNPVFEWSNVAGATRYILQVDDLSTAESVFREDQLTGVSFTPATALPSGNYRAWVRAVSADGTFSPWSVFVDFDVT